MSSSHVASLPFQLIRRERAPALAQEVHLLLILPLVFHDDAHPHHFDFEGWPAFGSAYGFVSCVVIILVSKLIGKLWLMRKEDHYDS